MRWLLVAMAWLVLAVGCAASHPAPIESPLPGEAALPATPGPGVSIVAPGEPAASPLIRYCHAKYGADPGALSACAPEELAAFERLLPALDRAAGDPQTAEAKILGSCQRRHKGPLGIDWMMVEHCFAKRTGAVVSGLQIR
jgi:hypothetical protein